MIANQIIPRKYFFKNEINRENSDEKTNFEWKKVLKIKNQKQENKSIKKIRLK